jgi:3-phenylpropionate/trans-cinnamate dioxygenase ferredoxin reductase subunit
MLTPDVLIAGAGHAGGMAAVALRQAGFTGSIMLVGQEPHAPYERPPLSKATLAGEMAPERLFLRKDAFWAERGIDLALGREVVKLRPDRHQADLCDGRLIQYRHAILATGGRARMLACPGSRLANIFTLRTLDDTAAIRAALAPGARLAVVGGGYIGLEVAASARKLGHEVTIIEAMDRVLARVTSPIVSHFYERQHRAHGATVLVNAQVSAFEGTDGVSAVVLADGRRIAADVVVVGIGIIPNAEVAERAGLDCRNGIVVDDHCRTSAPDVYAIGDVALHPNRFAPDAVRLESVQNAIDQGKVVAGMITGAPKAYGDVPWFWSDQYDLKLQTAGLSIGYDQTVVRGDPEGGTSFSVAYLRGGVLIALDAVNAIKDFMASKQLVAQRVAVDPAQLADPAVALKSLIPAAA